MNKSKVLFSLGLLFFSVQTLFSANILNTIDTGNPVAGLDISNNKIFTANGPTGLVIRELSPMGMPSNSPTTVTTPWAKDVDVSGDFAYVADDSQGLIVIDLETNTTISTITPSTGWSTDIEVRDNFAYLANNHGGVFIYDISTPSNPTQVGHYDTNGHAVDLDVVGDRLYIADNAQGFKIIDVSNPSNPTLIASQTIGGFTGNIEVQNNIAYVTTNSTSNGHVIQSYDISNEQNIQLLDTLVIPSIGRDLVLRGTIAYVANFVNGVQFIDIGNSSDLSILSSIDTEEYANSLVVAGSRMFVGDSNNLVTIDIWDIETPRIVSNIDIPNYGKKVVSSGDYTYTIDTTKKLSIIDNSNIGNPSTVGTYTFSEQVNDLDIVGNYVHAVSNNHLYIINTTNKSNPTLSTKYFVPQSTTLSSVTLKELKKLDGTNGYFMFLTDFSGNVMIYNKPHEYSIGSRKMINLPIGSNFFAPQPHNIDVYQNDENIAETALYIAGGQAGIYTVELNTTNIMNSSAPVNEGFDGNYGNAKDVTVTDDTSIFVVADSLGVVQYTNANKFKPEYLRNFSALSGAVAIDSISNSSNIIVALYDNDSAIFDPDNSTIQSFTTSNGYSGNDIAVSNNREKGITTILDMNHGVFFIDTSMIGWN
ncbi:MAG: beta-propeller domain-containing protein [Campylobacterales bacterium]|nr:beta-propeller domain-containing protein [Campylobacterales bacterium]